MTSLSPARISEREPRKGTETQQARDEKDVFRGIFQNVNPERGRKQTYLPCHTWYLPLISEREPRKGTETNWDSFSSPWCCFAISEREPRKGTETVTCGDGCCRGNAFQNVNPERGRKLPVRAFPFLPFYTVSFQNVNPERGRKLYSISYIQIVYSIHFRT